MINYFVGYGQITNDLKVTPTPNIIPQTVQNFRTVCYSYNPKRNSEYRYFFIYDGIPIFSNKKMRSIFNEIDTTTIDSIYIKKGSFIKCHEKAYNAIIILSTNDSINIRLKHILTQTNNWIVRNPTSDIIINNKKQKLNKSLVQRLSNTDTKLIEDIETIAPDINNGDCNNGVMKLKIGK
jgi:hypothetical protein